MSSSMDANPSAGNDVGHVMPSNYAEAMNEEGLLSKLKTTTEGGGGCNRVRKSATHTHTHTLTQIHTHTHTRAEVDI